jgi:hypothetical protein
VKGWVVGLTFIAGTPDEAVSIICTFVGNVNFGEVDVCELYY